MVCKLCPFVYPQQTFAFCEWNFSVYHRILCKSSYQREVDRFYFPCHWHYGNLFVCLQSPRQSYLYLKLQGHFLHRNLFSVSWNFIRLFTCSSCFLCQICLVFFKYFQNKISFKRSHLKWGETHFVWITFKRKTLFSWPVALCFVKNVAFGTEVIVLLGNAPHHFCQYVLQSAPFPSNTHTHE